MKRRVIVDTGILVAVLNKNDRHHAWVVRELTQIEPPLLTCDAVISETCFLARNYAKQDILFKWLEQGTIKPVFQLADNIQAVRSLMVKYVNVPMSFADACLVRMAEVYEGSSVFSVDTDFLIYRKHGNVAIPIICPVGSAWPE